jgi:GAF domain-containing protein
VVRLSLVSLLDHNIQLFKSQNGLDVSETPKEFAFCAQAINSTESVFVVNDTLKDELFQDNPLVTGEPYVIFYAGAPLVGENGLPFGTFCVIDNEPKVLKKTKHFKNAQMIKAFFFCLVISYFMTGVIMLSKEITVLSLLI